MNFFNDAWPAIALTLKLAGLSSGMLLIIATPIAWWLSQTSSVWRKPIAALITLPLVLPPTVLGFYILVMLGPQGWLGGLTQSLGLGVLSFSFTGLLIGSLIFSLPFAVQPIQYAFEAMGKRP
ncbi:MAG: molybdate transporter permease subunit, partial [Pseudomonadota bacterium]